MPRIMAPPPSGEFNVTVHRPFSGPATQTIQITGEPNRNASIRTKRTTGGSIIEKKGEFPSDDVNELLTLVQQVRGFPSSTSKDIFGQDAKLELQTFEIQWSNDDEDPSASVETVEDETKKTFKDVVDSIEAAARQFAKQDSAV